MRIPLIYSNPRLWTKPQTSQVMVSHVDLLRTLASLANAPRSARASQQGVDYSDHILERLAPPTQDYVVFTYDDFQAGQSSRPYVKPPQHIASLRKRHWKIAEYYDAKGRVPSRWEMYDSSATRSSARTSRTKGISARQRGRSSIGASNASWRESRGSACIGCQTLPSPRPWGTRTARRREARWTRPCRVKKLRPGLARIAIMPLAIALPRNRLSIARA